jgi:hypothetical protein
MKLFDDNNILDRCLYLNPLNAKLNPICHLLALLGAHHVLHVSRIRVKDTELQAYSHCKHKPGK